MKLIVVFLILAAFYVSGPSAFARLGDNENSIDHDVVALHGVRKKTAHDLYTVHEITNDAQTVREYVGKDGTVFAVRWKGIGAPDLSDLFGAYYQEYQDADAATPRPRGRAPKTVKSSNLVVHRFGHMGDVQGIAYVPALVPNGVTVKDLR